MKRRQVMQAMVVAPVVAALPSGKAQAKPFPGFSEVTLDGPGIRFWLPERAGDRMRVELTVYPRAGKFASGFQKRVETWERWNGKHFRPIEAVVYAPLEADDSPWLAHSAWNPPSLDNPAILYSEAAEVFENRRWRLIDRAVALRLNAFWRAEWWSYWEGTSIGEARDRYRVFLVWRDRMLQRLDRVVVTFEAERKRDHEAT